MKPKSREHPLYVLKFITLVLVFYVCHLALGISLVPSIAAAWLSAGIVGVFLARQVLAREL